MELHQLVSFDPGVHEVRPALRHPPIGVVHRGDDRLSPAARALAAHLAQAARRA